ncbi:MAG: MerR family transcriptional regulator, partial [Erysipelotrichia bacterium]|nr:MerR family transcriptional regulator [Erysipelotrichia bacterium]
LMYYDDIQLFSPLLRKDNNYRMYSIKQVTHLELILSLRELGMSLDAIQTYLKNKNAHCFAQLLTIKMQDIDEQIKTLKKIKSLLAKKEEQLKQIAQIQLDTIQIKTQKEELLYVSEPIQNVSEQEEVEIIFAHCEKYHAHRFFNQSFGTMIHLDELVKHNYLNHTCYYSKADKKHKDKQMHIKPSGEYLTIYYKGAWENHPYVYEKLLNYAKDNHLTLSGYAYEEGMNELTRNDMSEYITRFQIQIKKD